MLDQSRGLLIAMQANGRIGRLPPNSQYRDEVESIEFPAEHNNTVAILVVCTIDDGEMLDAATGQVSPAAR